MTDGIVTTLRANALVCLSLATDGSVSGFRVGNQRLSGLHRFLDTNLAKLGKLRPWRKNVHKISAGGKTGSFHGAITKKGRSKGVRQKKVTAQENALSFGKEVHSQIERFVQDGTVVTNKVAKNALDILEKGRFVPIACETRVFCKTLGIGTAVDLVCYKRKKGKVSDDNVDKTKVYLMEIKTGYDGTFNCGFGNLYHNGKKIAKYSPRTRTCIQLALTKAMFEMTYQNIPVAGTRVLLLQSKGSTLFSPKPLLPEFSMHDLGTSTLEWRR